jgi:hypothetical protein
MKARADPADRLTARAFALCNRTATFKRRLLAEYDALQDDQEQQSQNQGEDKTALRHQQLPVRAFSLCLASKAHLSSPCLDVHQRERPAGIRQAVR